MRAVLSKPKKPKMKGKMSESPGFTKWGSAKQSKSGKGINFIPSKDEKAKGQKAFTMSLAQLLKLINGEVQFISVSAMPERPQ